MSGGRGAGAAIGRGSAGHRCRGLTLVEVLLAAVLLAILAAAAAPLIGDLAAGHRRLHAADAVDTLAAGPAARVAAALGGEPVTVAGGTLDVVAGTVDTPAPKTAALLRPGLRRFPAPGLRWVECRLRAAGGRVVARCPRLLPAPGPGGAAPPAPGDPTAPPAAPAPGTPPTVLP